METVSATAAASSPNPPSQQQQQQHHHHHQEEEKTPTSTTALVVAPRPTQVQTPKQQQQQQQQQQQPLSGAEMLKKTAAGYLTRSQQLLHVKRFHEALAMLAKGANLRPEDGSFVLLNVLRADAYSGLLDFGSAIACLRAGLHAAKFESERTQIKARLVCALDTAAVSLLQRGRPEPAYDLAAEASQLDGGQSLEVHLHRCLCLVGLQRLEEASNEFAALRFAAETVENKAVALESTVMCVHLSIVQRRFEEAKQFLDKCSRQSSDGTAWSDHPRIIELEREFDAAFHAFVKEARDAEDVEALTLAISCFPNDPELYRARAEALVDKGVYAQGIQDYFKCVEKNSGKDDAAQLSVARTLHTVATKLASSGDIQGAITYLTESFKWNSKSIEVIVMRGDCLVQMREHESALGDFRRAQDLEPGNLDVRARISELHNMWGTHLFEAKKYREAEDAFTRAIEISEQEPRYFYFRARCRLLSAQSPEDHMLAVRDLIECRNLGTTDPEILLLVAQLCAEPKSAGADVSPQAYAKMTPAVLSALGRDSGTGVVGGGGNSSQQQNKQHHEIVLTSSQRAALATRRRITSKTQLFQHQQAEEEDMKVLRSNRSELLASPIDSKKLREASASITDPAQYRARQSATNKIWLKKDIVSVHSIQPKLQRHEFGSGSAGGTTRGNNNNKLQKQQNAPPPPPLPSTQPNVSLKKLKPPPAPLLLPQIGVERML